MHPSMLVRCIVALLVTGSVWLTGCQPNGTDIGGREGVSADATMFAETPACDPEFNTALTQLAQAVRLLELDGAALFVRQGTTTLCEAYLSHFDPFTAVPVVSSAKWLSAAAILSLVDDGSLSLDDPVSKFLPYFRGPHSSITLRQLLSHTSGLPDYVPCMFEVQLLLDDCVRQISAVDLLNKPGTEFRYGGSAFSVAGRVAEVAGKQPWAQLFESRIAQPLGLTHTHYGNTKNPILSEGYVTSSMRDYATFLQMVLNGGSWNGKQILSPEVLDEMLTDHTLGKTVAFSPGGPDTAYGLGLWRDRINDEGVLVEVSSPGGGGFYPWVDYERDLIGIIMFFDRIERTWRTITTVKDEVERIVDARDA